MPKRRKTTKKTRLGLYAVAQYLGMDAQKELGKQIPFDVYLQDPLVAEEDPKFGFDQDFFVHWEPGLTDGPTSARFAVVDYNGDTGEVWPMARWDKKREKFLDPDDQPLDRGNVEPLQFHQMNVWAVLQRALDFFEQGQGLGRRIPWGFEGNRLIVVPHAGYGKNAFYDRRSKSLQFYYFDDKEGRVYTCLSTDIINHELGHAVLDGVRPYFSESTSIQTAAFHESVGDLTAILILLRNNAFRRELAERTDGKLAAADHLANIAEQFGRSVKDLPYLRTARNELKMSDIADVHEPHHVSEVMTGAMFDILLGFGDHYFEVRGETPKTAFWHAIERMQRTAIQPLDLLPPVDVTFKDYALAVLRADELSNPTDPHLHYERMLKAFEKREILDADDIAELRRPRYLYDRLRTSVFHDVDDLSRSRAAAYRFLDDNRKELFIPANHDVIVADLYDANKLTRQGQRLPRQIILVYVWRETLILEGERFGRFAGNRTTILCGGTLVFDQNGSIISWFRKPGIHVSAGRKGARELAAGEQRRERILADVASNVGAGRIGVAIESEGGMLGTRMPPMTVREARGALRFELTPHLNLSGDAHSESKGGPRWEISS